MACPFDSKENQQKGIYKNTTKRALQKTKALTCFRKRTETDGGQATLEKKRVNLKRET